MKKRARNRHSAEASINLTSLMDITFVLLIAFMIIAPAVRYDVDLELPKVEESDSQETTKQFTLQITWNSTSETTSLFLNGSPLSRAEYIEALNREVGSGKKPPIAFEADRSVPWEKAVAVINELKTNGFENLIIITERGA